MDYFPGLGLKYSNQNRQKFKGTGFHQSLGNPGVDDSCSVPSQGWALQGLEGNRLLCDCLIVTDNLSAALIRMVPGDGGMPWGPKFLLYSAACFAMSQRLSPWSLDQSSIMMRMAHRSCMIVHVHVLAWRDTRRDTGGIIQWLEKEVCRQWLYYIIWLNRNSFMITATDQWRRVHAASDAVWHEAYVAAASADCSDSLRSAATGGC